MSISDCQVLRRYCFSKLITRKLPQQNIELRPFQILIFDIVEMIKVIKKHQSLDMMETQVRDENILGPLRLCSL